jgi:alkyl sulfatase BDS1-like metallo-beta-lactamase superfamily hydrolase
MMKQFEVTPAIHPELRAHGAIFQRKIYKVGDNVYSAIGWANGGTIMVVGDDGVIIVDTGPDIRSAEFREITDKPVRAVIYTAFHVDHINGVKAFASAEDVKAGHVSIIAQEKLLANVIRSSATIGPILGARSIYNFGYGLAGPDIEGMNNGNGPLTPTILEPPTFIAPTITFQSKLDITIAGVTMNLVHVPSSAADQVAVFLPQHKILLSSELIPAQHFPTLYTLRGETYRDPADWYRSIDVLRRFGAVAIVPSKMPPVIGEDEVEEVMRNYRDAIQFVHDQTIRQMNKGSLRTSWWTS